MLVYNNLQQSEVEIEGMKSVAVEDCKLKPPVIDWREGRRRKVGTAEEKSLI